MFSKITYQYDEEDNLIREKSYCPDGNICEEKRFEYEFDKKGNWIKKMEKLTEGTVLVSETVYDRSIKY